MLLRFPLSSILVVGVQVHVSKRQDWRDSSWSFPRPGSDVSAYFGYCSWLDEILIHQETEQSDTIPFLYFEPGENLVVC